MSGAQIEIPWDEIAVFDRVQPQVFSDLARSLEELLSEGRIARVSRREL